MVLMGLHCHASSSQVAEGGAAPVLVLGFLIVEASPDTEVGLWGAGVQ